MFRATRVWAHASEAQDNFCPPHSQHTCFYLCAFAIRFVPRSNMIRLESHLHCSSHNKKGADGPIALAA